MALIIEDGSIVASAQSYATAAELASYAALRGTSITADETEQEQLLIKAMDYLEGLRDKFKGVKVSTDQSLQWPRSGVTIDGLSVSYEEIPRELLYAQLALAIEAYSTDIMPNLPSTGDVTREKVGPIEVEYDNKSKVLGVSAFAKSSALIAPLLKRNGLLAIRA